MAEIDLCTDAITGPYLIAPERLADELKARFDAAEIPCQILPTADVEGLEPGQCVIHLGVGTNMWAVSEELNNGDYDWHLAGM